MLKYPKWSMHLCNCLVEGCNISPAYSICIDVIIKIFGQSDFYYRDYLMRTISFLTQKKRKKKLILEMKST